MTRTWLIGVLALGAAGHAAAGGLCDTLAAQLKAGAYANQEDQRLLTALALRSGGRLAVVKADNLEIPALLDQIHAGPDIREDFAERVNNAELYRDAATGLGMIDDVQGTAYCENWTFFVMRSGQAVKVEGPPGFDDGEGGMCWYDGAEPVRMGGRTALVEDDESGGPGEIALTIWPRTASGWGAACRLKARFEVTLVVESAQCRPGESCDAVAREAIALAGRRERGQALPKASAAAVALTKSSEDKFRELPDFGDPVVYDELDDPKPAAWPGADRRRFAMVAGGRFAWRSYNGHLVAVYELRGGKAQPVAGIQVARRRGRLISVAVDTSVSAARPSPSRAR